MNIKVILLVFGLGLISGCSSSKINTYKIEASHQVRFEQLNLPNGVSASDVNWNALNGEVSFIKNTSFSSLQNTDKDVEGFYWEVPKFIKRISIKKGVKIVGGFRLSSSVEIIGEDRATCEIFGTDTKNWALGPDMVTHPETSCKEGPMGDDYIDDCGKWRYGAISVSGNSTIKVSVKNLTITNSRTYAITSFNPKLHIENVYILAKREEPDYKSNSDGISAGKGSVIKNCKIDVWDDAIKLYRDTTVENVTIVHNPNGAPFQLGWGSGVEESTHHLKNILVEVSNHKRYNLSLFSASIKSGSYKRTINVEGIKANYGRDLKLSSLKSFPLFNTKSNVDIAVYLSKKQPVHLSAKEFLLGVENTVSVFVDGELRNYSEYLYGDANKITGCGW